MILLDGEIKFKLYLTRFAECRLVAKGGGFGLLDDHRLTVRRFGAGLAP